LANPLVMKHGSPEWLANTDNVHAEPSALLR
jgi:hypothetical protein